MFYRLDESISIEDEIWELWSNIWFVMYRRGAVETYMPKSLFLVFVFWSLWIFYFNYYSLKEDHFTSIDQSYALGSYNN